MRLSVDDPDVEPLRNTVGAFIVNFGHIELLADGWVHGLSMDAIAAAALRKTPSLGRKIDTILEFLAADRLGGPEKEEATELWQEAKGHLRLRNKVAHNPIIFDRDEAGSAVRITILDKQSGERIHHDEVIRVANELRRIAESIHTLSARLDHEGAWPTGAEPERRS